MLCFLIWPLSKTHRECVFTCPCVYVPAHYCVYVGTLINRPHLGKWWFKHAPTFVNTGIAAQTEMGVDLCSHPDGRLQWFWGWPRPVFLPRPMTNHSKMCGAFKILPPHHSCSPSSSANGLRDADEAQKVTWKGSVPFGKVLLLLEVREWGGDIL